MERLRVIARRLVSPHSALYATAAHVYNDLEITRREGLSTTRTIRRLARARGGQPHALRLKNLRHPILVRPGTDDVPTIINNVVREEYAYGLPDWQPRVMIDAGAFIGDTSAYFLSRYPTLTAIAIEPEADNLALAARNLAAYGDRARLLRGALAGRDGSVRARFPKADNPDLTWPARAEERVLRTPLKPIRRLGIRLRTHLPGTPSP